jgi:hypothetical protein
VTPKSEITKFWTCPKCGRQFERHDQSHSYRAFPLQQHFTGKNTSKLLYEKFKQAVKKQLRPFTIESLECCLHFVSTFTFVAIKILSDKIRGDFSLSRKIKNKQINQCVQISAQGYLYIIDIEKEEDIDAPLMEWIKEA